VWIAGLAVLKGRAPWSRDRAGLCRPKGWGQAEIVNVCGSPPWQALVARSGGDCVGMKGGSLGYCGPGWAEERAQRSEIPQPAAALQACGAGLGMQHWLFF
jgi:hypothetical protein